ncbi:TetR/AcrR family transcriptional regulator C-terminal domain-containing protein [Amycolatopsis rhabdoformis]|uniref:TetR/AcrR family transcriptional regulator C-terminal domain-containing protein n=1 Tax=Amycolatopsis rhabdoformis TaxID=1448059 RepID=A0ABZ1IDG6_9PSEU|nr:TetR/AcrR family transcriptional regulator C-terminal domain-containing protein [Amycolatopsis rhabdoformis]WSE32505.1 TetR/AcrR family transcriptional regulator C-terminal domain-containing protein [Amycolatopsis rhabdoformis]
MDEDHGQSADTSAPPRRAGRPARINREQLVDAVLSLVDAEGLEAVSMRRLAAILDVKSPSLYNHVRTKEELLDLAADSVVATVDATSFDTEHWLVGLERWARSYHEAILGHPNMVPWLARGVQRGEQSLRNVDKVYGGLTRAGWSPRYATLIGSSTRSIVYGSAMGSFAGGFPDDPGAYPSTLEHIVNAHELRSRRDNLDREAFELALRFLLDGAERLHAELGQKKPRTRRR